MKKSLSLSLAAAAVLSLTVPSAVSAGGYGAAGCGLGAVVFGSKPGFVQVMGSATNALSSYNYSQMFGITSGTSECGNSNLRVSAEQETFAYNNFAQLRSEIALGRGERLYALGYLFGCNAKHMDTFAQNTRDNYDLIFANQNNDATIVLQRIRDVSKHNSILTVNCDAI